MMTEFEEQEIEDDQPDKAERRAGLKTLAVLVLILSLISSIFTCIVLNSDFIARKFLAERVDLEDQMAVQEFRQRVERLQLPRALQEIVFETIRQVDFDSYIKGSPWRTVRWSAGIKLFACLTIFLAAVLTFMSKPIGPKLIIWSSLLIVLMCAIESISLYVHGQDMVFEFHRDMKARYFDLVESAEIDDEFREPIVEIEPWSNKRIQIIALGNFAISSFLWQITAFCFACCRPLGQIASQKHKEESEE